MQNSLNSAGLFLISTIFNLYLLVLIIRMVLAWVHADYYSPFTQVIVRFTKPIINPLRKVIPNYKGIEISTLLVILVLVVLKSFLTGLILIGLPSNYFGLFIVAIADLVELVLYTFFGALLLQAILSWTQPYSPIMTVLNQLTAPILRPIRRIVRPINGFDLAPLPAMIIIELLIILLVGPLQNLGMGVTFG